MKRRKEYWMSVLSVVIIIKITCGNYVLNVTLHSLENRGGRCADEQFCDGGEGCCESSTCATTACLYTLEFCHNISPVPISDQRSVNMSACAHFRKSLSTSERIEGQAFHEQSLVFSGSRIIHSVIQIHFELQHNNTVLIDRFFLEVLSTPGSQLGPFFLDGIFGYARMNMSTSFECASGNCGPLCEQSSNCTTCEPGYTGRFCSDIISTCVNVSCGNPNMKCMDNLLSYSCLCKPGFTGPDCLGDIDECTNEDERCSINGKCVNTPGSFLCECNEEYTGQFCETRLPRYTIDIILHSFDNPGGKCADTSGTCASGTGCCDSRQCHQITCDYMFLYCLRPFDAPVSYYRSENRGNCFFSETSSRRIAVRDNFLSNIYGTQNPIHYTIEQMPIDGVEFYIELIDDDRDQIGEENNELVDRFVIPITNSASKSTYMGIFGLASINLSVHVNCSEFYSGDNCEQLNIVTIDSTSLPSSSSESNLIIDSTSSVLPGISSELNSTVPIIAGLLFGMAFIIITATTIFFIMFGYIWKNKNLEKMGTTRTIKKRQSATELPERSNPIENLHYEANPSYVTGTSDPNYDATYEDVVYYEYIQCPQHEHTDLEATNSPTVCDVNVFSLEKPDFKLLLWDSVVLSKESMRLGVPLKAGKELHTDLQNTNKYILGDEKENDDIIERRNIENLREGRKKLEGKEDREEGKQCLKEVKESSENGSEDVTTKDKETSEELAQEKENSARKDEDKSHYYHVLEIQELSD